MISGFRWSAGSAMFLVSWAVLMGPMQYAQHLVSGNRLPFTVAYFGSIALTMYFAIGVSLNFITESTPPLPQLSMLDPNNNLSVCTSKYTSFAKTRIRVAMPGTADQPHDGATSSCGEEHPPYLRFGLVTTNICPTLIIGITPSCFASLCFMQFVLY